MLNEKSLAGIAQTMSSLQIAEITGKQHAHVMRDIRKMVESINKSNQSTCGLVDGEYHRGDRTQYKYLSERSQKAILDFAFGNGTNQYQITETSYVDAKGEARSMYNLNKKACFLLASGYDVILRAKIIDRWEELEREKLNGGFAVPTSFAEALQLAADQARQIEKLETANRQQERTIAKLKPKADFADTAFNADTLVTMSQAAKILKLDFGRNTLFKKLREHGILFRHSNEPAQKYVNAGYFTVVEGAPIQRSDGRMFIPITTYCTQKGLAFLHQLFGGDGFALKLL